LAIGKISGVELIGVASAVEVGPAPPPPPGAKVPVASTSCCRFDGGFFAEDVPILDGDVKGVDGTNAEELLLPDRVVDAEAEGIDAREAEDDTAGGGVCEGEMDGSEILPEGRSRGSGGNVEMLEEAVEELEGYP
jgi:hypothetical protein